MSSDLLVPGLSSRAFFQIHAFEDGIRSHTLFDVENRLLQTLFLVQFGLFRRFLLFQRLVVREKIGLFLRGGRDILLPLFSSSCRTVFISSSVFHSHPIGKEKVER